MPLPKIDLPIYELKLVSIPKPIKYRPFLVKEEKLLLMALQSNDEENIFNTIRQVINNCLLTDGIDIETIPIFDLEYLFLQLRAQSMGNIVETNYMCRNRGDAEQEMCSNMMKIGIDLFLVQPPIKNLPSRIQLTNNIGIQMKFPNMRSMRTVKDIMQSADSDAVYRLMFDCLDFIYDSEDLHYASETSFEEFKDFIESLTQDQFDNVVDFFDKIPNITHTLEHKCEKCGFEHKITMEGLVDFFT